jgi:hypothetical protein
MMPMSAIAARMSVSQLSVKSVDAWVTTVPSNAGSGVGIRVALLSSRIGPVEPSELRRAHRWPAGTGGKTPSGGRCPAGQRCERSKDATPEEYERQNDAGEPEREDEPPCEPRDRVHGLLVGHQYDPNRRRIAHTKNSTIQRPTSRRNRSTRSEYPRSPSSTTTQRHDGGRRLDDEQRHEEQERDEHEAREPVQLLGDLREPDEHVIRGARRQRRRATGHAHKSQAESCMAVPAHSRPETSATIQNATRKGSATGSGCVRLSVAWLCIRSLPRACRGNLTNG